MKRVRRIVGPAVVPILAVLSAFLVGSVFMFITDLENLKTFPTDPVGTIVAGIGRIGDAYYYLIIGAFGDPTKIIAAIGSNDPKAIAAAIRPLTETLVASTPLIFCGLAVAIAFRSGVFNIGVGVLHSHSEVRDDGKVGMKDVNLRDLLKVFAECYAPARELMAGGTLRGDYKGAPLRCTLEGARWSRPGLLVTGEAAGSTYAFTGEGIGKAMETGIQAAQALLAAKAAGSDDASVCAGYETSLAALKPRFDLYERANHVNAHPWLADLLIWRARRSARLRKRMAGVLDETSNPGHLITLKGITRLFTE